MRNQNQPRKTDHEPDHYERRSSSTYGSQRYAGESNNPYGEHPASRGAEEYRGNNKRHPELGGYNSSDEMYRDRNDDPYEHYNNRTEDRHAHEHSLDSEYREYLNRGQYERRFHGRNFYDPMEVERAREEDEYFFKRDRSYRHDGAQAFGNTEGFGVNGSRQGGEDWRDEDYYREGHTQRKIGSGKYGSR